MIVFFKIGALTILFAVCIMPQANASVETNSAAGINSVAVPYTGDGISIGQVELKRPGKFGFDNGSNSNFGTIPKEVYLLDDRVSPTANSATEIFEIEGTPPVSIAHATQVAGVLIGKDPLAPGVAIDADLYATAGTFPQTPSIPTADSMAISAQFIATRDNGDVRAINMSFLVLYEAGNIGNGNSLFTQFVDWSAAEHNVLYVAIGRNSDVLGLFGQPLDNFNGVTVAASEKVDGVYRKFGSTNNTPFPTTSGRTHIDLLAPGQQLAVADAGGDVPAVITSGTSFAAPHVTGTVALLQEYGDAQIAAGAPNWGGMNPFGPEPGPTPRRHEVMKAVLMNSADKVQGILGMDRTVLKQNGVDTWFESDAASNASIPLDIEMGAGHLNAKRALDQFMPGEFDTTNNMATVPLIGWDYGFTPDNVDIQKYVFDVPLEEDDYVSATLAWEREVELNFDAGTANEYDIGDDFFAQDVTNLELYLLPGGSTDVSQAIASSTSSEMNLEHLFFKIPTDGTYEIWVWENSPGFGFGQDYALAW